MTKTDWTAEEVRAQAKLERRDRGDVLTEAMLTAFAERIERAQAGVTDEVTWKVTQHLRRCKLHAHTADVKEALLAVWPTAAERIAADERAVPVAYQCRIPTGNWHECTFDEYEYVSHNRPEDARKLYTHSSPPAQEQPGWKVPDVVNDVMAELEKAIRKFPTWPTDPLHALGVLNEEIGELNKAVLQQVYEPSKNPTDAVRNEALQSAAMMIRFLVSMDTYQFNRSYQHEQGHLK